MPRVEASANVPVSCEIAFAVSQTQGEIRYRWDRFVSEQRLLGGATAADKGVQTETVSRHRLRMVSEYVSFDPPSRVGMRMIEGPWFFDKFGGGWSFAALDDGTTEATWRYTFTVRPSWLAPVADRIGLAILGRDIRRRLDGFVEGCRDPVVLESARELAASWSP